ncbi:MAG: hypothetical protein M3362_26540 [Acidobacteriota bacterium]|nr:hypothetical protein [Acidobacteriota bacterium]
MTAERKRQLVDGLLIVAGRPELASGLSAKELDALRPKANKPRAGY